MKTIVLLISLTLTSLVCFGQAKCISADRGFKREAEVLRLEQKYKPLMEVDSLIFTDTTKVTAFVTNATQFFTNLATYLNDNGFLFGQKTRLNIRLYVNENGKVAYFVYTHGNTGARIRTASSGKFRQLCTRFLETTSISFDYGRKFGYSATVDFTDFENATTDIRW